MQDSDTLAKNHTPGAPQLDLSFMNAASVITAAHRQVHFVMVGCGGTGSWLAPAIARLMRILQEIGIKASALFVDPDYVEEKNIPRQNFCDAEVGYPKAQTLAARYGLAWGLEIRAINGSFSTGMIGAEWSRLTVMIGCVDNAAARQEMAKALNSRRWETPPTLWWLDCGNRRESGQALLGSTGDPKVLQRAFPMKSLCQHLPSPVVQCPDLLIAQPEELINRKLSCAELALDNSQGLIVNQRVAAEAADFLDRLLVRRNLRRFATYFDLASGSVKNYCISPETIGAFTTTDNATA
jgi:PRTRC genetic system ThiF family protein